MGVDMGFSKYGVIRMGNPEKIPLLKDLNLFKEGDYIYSVNGLARTPEAQDFYDNYLGSGNGLLLEVLRVDRVKSIKFCVMTSSQLLADGKFKKGDIVNLLGPGVRKLKVPFPKPIVEFKAQKIVAF